MCSGHATASGVYRAISPLDTGQIVSVFVGACVACAVFFILHRRLAGAHERAGLWSMLAFVAGWLSVLTAAITGLFLLSLRE
jgi:hypothetical protein